MTNLNKSVAIVGAYEHPTRYAPDKSDLQLLGESVIGALDDAGLAKSDIDAFFTSGVAGLSALVASDYLNLYPTYVDDTSVGGSSYEFHLSHAMAGIQTGRFNCALIAMGRNPRSGASLGRTRPAPIPESFEDIYGTSTIGLYAMAATRHMHVYGTTSEQLAQVAVAARAHAHLNPNAAFRDPITVDDVLKSRSICHPFHLMDCCIVSDGAGAVIVTSAAKAKTCRKKPVWVLGAGEAVGHLGAGKADLLHIGAERSGPAAMGMAGVTHRDIDMCMIYDSFTYTVVATLEALGFCKPGEGGAFVSGGRIQLGGELPINTDGGGLSSCHPGMRGIFLLVEATKQLRGEKGPAQVPDCKLALVNGTGGWLGSRHGAGTVILGRD